ncbi:MAG TPA: endonuclease domain-containing protein [Candidatus Andersenbacteria bacterium]|nr:endonuclease domain-containing protein [Candidatus Andersenbacteria bacterium]
MKSECYDVYVPIIFNGPKTKQTRRNLRKKFTEPEDRLWYYLRARRLNGLKFRRQYAIGRYIVDFYCPELRLIIEVDGDSHFTDEAKAYDEEREQYLKAHNLQIIRFTNDEVLQNIKSVIDRIVHYGTSSPPSP